jgi:HEAT repeat protein
MEKSMSAKRLKILMRDLLHTDPSRRYAAAEALSCADERALYPLIKALRDENPGVQDAAMRSLISIGGEVAAYMAIPLLREEPHLRNMALIILKTVGSASIPHIRPLLSDKDDDIRKFAVDLISEIGYCACMDGIVHLLGNDPNPNVRVSAAKAIGILRYRDALPQLIIALKDDEWVCFAALEALALLKDESSISQVSLLLDGPSDAVRIAAIETLGAIGTSGAANALHGHLLKAGGYEKSLTVKSLVTMGVIPSCNLKITYIKYPLVQKSKWRILCDHSVRSVNRRRSR